MTLGGSLRSGTPLLLALAAVSVFAFAHPVHAATRTWDGGGATNNWSEAANWSSNTLPGTSDVATFDATSTKNATIDGNISVSGVDINTGYSGTITQGATQTVTVGTGNFDISAGTWTASAAASTVNGTFKVSGGTFNAGSGTVTLASSFTVSSGNFNENTSTIRASGAGSATYDVVTSETFYNLEIAKTGSAAVTPGSGDGLIIAHTLTQTSGQVGTGSWSLNGNGVQSSAAAGGAGTINFTNDAVSQTYTVNGGVGATIRLDSSADASDSIVFAAAGTLTSLVTTSGFSGTIPIVNSGDYNVTINAWQQAGGSYDASAQTSWTVGSGGLSVGSGASFTPPVSTTVSGFNSTWDVDSTFTVNNLYIDKLSSQSLTIASGDTIIVTGSMGLIGGNVQTGTIKARGGVVQSSTFQGGSAIIDFDDAGAQTYTMNGGVSPTIRMDSTDDASDNILIGLPSTINNFIVTAGYGANPIQIDNASDYTITIGTWSQGAGSYDASAQSNWVSTANFTIGSGATFAAPATFTVTGSNATWDVDGSQDFNDLVIGKTASQSVYLTTGDTVVILGDFVLTSGALTTTIGGTALFEARGDITQHSTFAGGGTAIVDFDSVLSQTFTLDGGVTPVIRLNTTYDASDAINVTAASTINLTTVSGFGSNVIPLNNPSDYVITVARWLQDDGTYDASAQTAWTVTGNITISTAANTFVPPVTVTATGSNATWDVNSTLDFDNLTINKLAQSVTIPTGDTLNVAGTLLLTDGSISTGIGGTGSIDALGNVTQASTFDGGTGTIILGNDAAAQTYTVAGGVTPAILLNRAANASDFLIFNAAATVNSLTVTSAFSGTIPIANTYDSVLTFTTWSQAAGDYDASGQSSWKFSTFGISGGTFVAPALTTAIGSNAYWAMSPAQAFNNFTLNKPSQQLIITGSNLIVNGTLTMTAGATSTGILEPKGNVVVASTALSSGRIDFTGSATQSFDLTGATNVLNGDIHVNKSGGEVDLASALVMDAASQDLIIDGGNFNLKGKNLTVNGTSGTIVVNNGGVLTLRGSETVTRNGGQPNLQAGSTVVYTGDGDSAADSYTITSLSATYSNLTINSADGATDSYVLGANADINGIFAVVLGSFDVSASNYSMNVAGDWYQLDVANMRSGSVTLDGSNQELLGSTNFYNLTKAVASAATLTFEDGESQVVGGTLVLTGASGNLLSLRSSVGGNAVSIDPQGAMVLQYLDVQDSNNVDANVAACGATCVDSGNNTNWTF